MQVMDLKAHTVLLVSEKERTYESSAEKTANKNISKSRSQFHLEFVPKQPFFSGKSILFDG